MSGSNPLSALSAIDPNWINPNPLQQGPSLADVWQQHYNEYQNWQAAQKADGIAKGLIDPETGWPTQKALVDAAHGYGNAMLMGSTAPGAKMPSGMMYSSGTKTGMGEPVAAYMNPSRSDIARMFEASAPDLHLRALQEGPNHAIWPAIDATHGQMAAPLGFSKDAVKLDYRGRPGDPDADFPEKAGRFSFWPTSH